MKKLLDRADAKKVEVKHEDFLKVEFGVVILHIRYLVGIFRGFHNFPVSVINLCFTEGKQG